MGALLWELSGLVLGPFEWELCCGSFLVLFWDIWGGGLCCGRCFAAMERSLVMSALGNMILFEVDSKVVARQVVRFGVGKYACRSETLKALFLRCVGIGHHLDRAGVRWRVRHVYREFNQTADTLANESIDLGSAGWASVEPRAIATP